MITDDEIERDRLAIEHFHSLKKHNSTRRERQDAWRVFEVIYRKRLARAARMHPISPTYRWSEFNADREGEWTYPYLRTLDPVEVDEMFPGALAAFATQCDDIPESRIVFDRGKGGRLRLSVPMRTTGDTPYINVTWLPEMGIWRRYCRHISCKPYVEVS